MNPNLKPYTETNITEFERFQITRYRTGAHYLGIEKGRMSNVKRENRLCLCKSSIQTLHHVLFDCTLTSRLPNISSLIEFFSADSKIITRHINDFKVKLQIMD